MKRRRFLIAAAAMAGGNALCAERATAPRIGILWVSGEGSRELLQAMRGGLNAKGYIDGDNIRIDDRFAVESYDQLPDAVAKLVREKVDVIFAFGQSAATAAVKATKTIPIVFISGGDPVKSGIVSSLSRPGSNATGISRLSVDLAGKRLQILKEVVTRVRRVGLLINSADRQQFVIHEYEAAAEAIGLAIQPIEVPGPDDFERTISGLARSNLGALVVNLGVFVANRKRLIDAIRKVRLPDVYTDRAFVEAGGLMAVGPNMQETVRRATSYIDKILKGAKPADLAVEQSDTFELAFNLGAAKSLGITIPQELIARADRVIG